MGDPSAVKLEGELIKACGLPFVEDSGDVMACCCVTAADEMLNDVSGVPAGVVELDFSALMTTTAWVMAERDVEGDVEPSARAVGAALALLPMLAACSGEFSGDMAGDADGDSSARNWSLVELNPELL